MFSPSQNSARSQIPALALHSAVDLMSSGHSALLPLQYSAKSHSPADVLHMVESGSNPHDPVPSQKPVVHTSSGHSSFISSALDWNTQ